MVPQQCTDFSGNTGPEEADTTRGPYMQHARNVVDDSLSMDVKGSQQCAERFERNNKAVYPSLCVQAGEGK